MNNSLISIIVPVYNVEKYIDKCVNSIINQTYKNLQIILVDDGSIDNSGKKCDEYKLKDNRIEVIHKENGGLSDARNAGLKIAKGEYIGFVDSDDYIAEDMYETLYNLITEENGDISECDFLRVDIEKIDDIEKILKIENSIEKTEKRVINSNQALEEYYGSRLQPYVKKVVVWNKLYKKDLFENIKFPIGKLHEDEFTTYKILDISKKIISINTKMYGYIQTKNSIMRKEISEKRIHDNLYAYEEASEYFKDNKKIEYKVQRRYLENCIELSGKVFIEKNRDKHNKLSEINNLFRLHYNCYLNNIISNLSDSNEKEIFELIKAAYKDNQKGYIPPIYWEELSKIINKK